VASFTQVKNSSTPRKYLTLQEKVQVIKAAEKDHGANTRSLAGQFQCGKTQIACILKKKESILSMYEGSISKPAVQAKLSRISEYYQVNEALYEWFNIACSKNMCPSGSELAQKARQMALALGIVKFKGSNGWLNKWKKRYNIKQIKMSGESGDVSGLSVDTWKERLPEILNGYNKEDILSLDETGFFWQGLPDKGFSRKDKGGKEGEKRVTVAFIVNAAGSKEKPVVIWKSANPQCFKKFDKSLLPVQYYSQSNALMTGEIMGLILAKLNHRLVGQHRQVILLMDNTGCHPESLKAKFTNIKIVFLPASTTSKLQPLELGIIETFKIQYRQLLLRYVLARINQCAAVTDVVETIDILVAVRWVALAWSKVTSDTISKCFRKAGILQEEMDVIARVTEVNIDPFVKAGEGIALQKLIDRTMDPEHACQAVEYVHGDDDLAVCVDLGGDDWEANFFAQLGQQSAATTEEPEDSQEEDCRALPTLHSFSEAMRALDDVKIFLESKGCVQEALNIGSAMDSVAYANQQCSTSSDSLTPCVPCDDEL
jgi:hypothetical protein